MKREMNTVLAIVLIAIAVVVIGVFVWKHTGGDVVSGQGNPQGINRRALDK